MWGFLFLCIRRCWSLTSKGGDCLMEIRNLTQTKKMKKFLLLACIAFSISSHTLAAEKNCCSNKSAKAAKCVGSKTCNACKNCKACKHCKAGGTCGVCKKA